MFFVYSVAADGWGTNIVSKVKYNEEVLTDILWTYAPFRCNVCGEVEVYDTLEEVKEDTGISEYNGEDFFIWTEPNDNWDLFMEEVSNLSPLT